MSINAVRLNLPDTALARIRRTLRKQVEENIACLRTMLGETPVGSSVRGEIQGWLNASMRSLEAPEGTPIALDGMAPMAQWLLLREATRLVLAAAYDAARDGGNPPSLLVEAIQDLRRLVVADRKA
jgi:hypothetical protein